MAKEDVNVEWRGKWWLPDKPDEAVPGTLIEREEDGEVLLKLIGGFSFIRQVEVARTPSTVSYEPEFIDEFPIILGSSSGAPITLLQCGHLHSGGAVQDIRVMRALRGIHLNDPNEEVFTSAALKIEYLLGWMRATTLRRTIELGNGHWTGRQSATTTPVDDLTATHDGIEYTLSVECHQFRIDDRPRANERSLANNEWAELTVKSPRPKRFHDFDLMAKTVMDLMTLAAHEPAGVIKETLWTVANDAAGPSLGGQRPTQVEVMGRQIHRPRLGLKEKAHAEYLFTLDDIPFAEVLPRWIDLHGRAWLACSTLFGVRYIREGYTTARLLAVATAAEALHRELHPEATHMPEKDFEAMRTRVMDAFKGRDADAKATRIFLSATLYNSMRYKDRLLALAAKPDQVAVARLINDVPDWAKYIKDQRNGIAHADRDRIDPDEGRKAFDALEITFALLGLVLLNELGLPAAVQRRAASAQYLHLIVDRFNRT